MTQIRETGLAVHPHVSAAFAALDAAGVDWALLRGVDELAAPTGDVDILVDAGATELDAALSRAGLVPVRARGHGSHRFYVGCSADDGWLMIDAVTDVAFGRFQECSTNVARALLDRRRRLGSVAVLDAADAFWHLLLHDALRDDDVPARHRDALRSQAWPGATTSPLHAVVSAIGPDVAGAFLAAVRDDDWTAVRALGAHVRRRWYRQRRYVRVRSALRAIERRLPARQGGGTSVAILGADGAGKTTLAEGLRASIRIPSRYVYLGIWRQTPLEERLRRVFGARLALRLAKLATKSVVIRYHRARGRVVLLDRFTCDADLPAADLDWKGRISALLVRRTCAEPDLILLLDAPVELMYSRKGEHGIDELQLRRDAYLAMGDRFPQMVVLDASEPVDLVRRRAAALVWDAWSRRTSAARCGHQTHGSSGRA